MSGILTQSIPSVKLTPSIVVMGPDRFLVCTVPKMFPVGLYSRLYGPEDVPISL